MCMVAADPERARDRVVLLWAETSRRVPLAPSLLLQYWLAVSTQPGSYQLQVRARMQRSRIICKAVTVVLGVQIRSPEGKFNPAQQTVSDLPSCMQS